MVAAWNWVDDHAPLFVVIAIVAVGIVVAVIAVREEENEHERCLRRGDDWACHRTTTMIYNGTTFVPTDTEECSCRSRNK